MDASDRLVWHYDRKNQMTESIQDTSPRIHSFAHSGPRNKKPVSDKGAPEFIRGVNASIL